MHYLFWNTNRNKVNDILKNIIIENKCDIIALAEYKDDIKELLSNLDNFGINMYHIRSIGCDRITIISKFKESQIKRYSESTYYMILKIPHESIDNQLIAFTHLPSKLYAKSSDLSGLITSLVQDLERNEKTLNSSNSIIMGDFNINPFEEGMIAAKSAHALPSKLVAKKKKRTVFSQEYNTFYNPMWNLFGDNDGVPGTYYYSASSQEVYFWNIFDQVIIRPDLIDNFDSSSLKIITKTTQKSLLNHKQEPNKEISDHLPIFFTIN
ncbi:MAG: endonuclease/exonuclease/phosphatase family protein [Clostridium perfringens]|nr:endonuclease/exonuclease/phosphatase family protein [Clostridium perfringens]